jgi:N utilization substance protein B
VIKVLYGHISGESTESAARKELALSIDKTYEQYKYLFCFLPMLQEYAQNKIDKGMQKHLPSDDEKNPNTKFINSKLIGQIAQNETLLQFMSKNSRLIAEAKDVVSKMYANMLEKDYFLEYMNSGENSFDEDRSLVSSILYEEFEDFDDLHTMLEEQNIYWTDEPEFVVSIILKTVKSIRENCPFELLPLYRNSDDSEFALRLLNHSMANYSRYRELIDSHTPRWDVERIAFVDALILVTSMSEMMEFPLIPIKVTLDEYIDIAHFYSTPSSNVFVNGVLDKMLKYLETNNLLNKQGKGLQ